jgi:hypothetical protein
MVGVMVRVRVRLGVTCLVSSVFMSCVLRDMLCCGCGCVLLCCGCVVVVLWCGAVCCVVLCGVVCGCVCVVLFDVFFFPCFFLVLFHV